MHERDDDLRWLQELLDRSDEHAGAHLRSIATAERRLSATALAELLTGVQVLSLATVTANCEPLVGPVDGLFYRGRFWFGSSPESVRFRHLRRRPQVSAAHVRGEAMAVIVHGTATEVDLTTPEVEGFRSYLVEVYGGEWWQDWGAGSPYARIDPTRMFAFALQDLTAA
jgi:hypothetical protein